MRLIQEKQKTQQVQLTLQQVSYFAAGCIITAFFIFIAGFYWGKKSITEVVLEEVAERLLTDKIHAALYKTYEKAQSEPRAQDMYSLHFGMFSTHKAAQACANKLKALDCPVQIEQRSSTTAQGKHSLWYEVVMVTSTGKTHAELEALQARIKQKREQNSSIVQKE
jgi:hypothetical protein